MPIQMNQDARLNSLWTMLHSASTGLRTRVEAILDNALHSSTNVFGTAAVLDTGTTAGDVPVLQGTGLLAPSIVPRRPAADFDGAFGTQRIPNLNAATHVYGTDDLGARPGEGWSVVLSGLSNPTSIGRLHVSQLPASIPAEAIVTGTVSEAVLPSKVQQIRSITGTPVLRHYTWDARFSDERSGSRDLTATGGPNIPEPTGRGAVRHVIPGGSITLSSSTGVLTINPVIVTLRVR